MLARGPGGQGAELGVRGEAAYSGQATLHRLHTAYSSDCININMRTLTNMLDIYPTRYTEYLYSTAKVKNTFLDLTALTFFLACKYFCLLTVTSHSLAAAAGGPRLRLSL